MDHTNKWVTEPTNYIDSLRTNLKTFMSENNYSVKKLAELADMPVETLKNGLYGNVKDCKLNSMVILAKAIGISVDELVGLDTMSEDEKFILQLYRKLPERHKYFLKWGLDFQVERLHDIEHADKTINVMIPEVGEYNNVKATNNFSLLDISNIPTGEREKIFLGVKIIDAAYMPVYSPYNVLLLANDRLPKENEHCLIDKGGNLWLAKRRVDSNGVNCYSIRDGKLRGRLSDNEIIGYVVDVYNIG